MIKKSKEKVIYSDSFYTRTSAFTNVYRVNKKKHRYYNGKMMKI